MSDASGEERRRRSSDGDRAAELVPWDIGHVDRAARRAQRHAWSLSPTIATKSRRRLAKGELQRQSTAASTAAPTTSPGRPTAPGSPTPSATDPRHCRHQALRASRRTAATLVTQPEFRDYSPAFDPDGKYLYFLSLRTFDPVYDSVQFELSFPRAARPYLIALQAGGAAAVRAARPKGSARRAATAKAGRRTARPPAVRVDLERHRAPRRRVPGPREPLRPDRRRRRQQGDLDRAAHRRRARPRRPQGASRQARASSTSRPARTETLAEKVERFALAQRRHDARLSRRQARCAPSPRTASADAASEPRRQPTTRLRARAAGSISTGPRCRSIRARSGGRCCARSGGCSATTSGRPTCPASTGTRSTRRYAPLLDRVCDARRALRPDLGDAGRARHLARLRDGRRPPQAARGGARAISARDLRVDARRRELRDRRHRARRPVGRRRRFPAQRHRRRSEGGRAHRRRQRPARLARRCRRRRCSSTRRTRRWSSRSRASEGERARGRDHDARRRSARALPRMGRAQPRLGARAVERPRRLLPPARHAGGGLRRVPPLLRRRNATATR